MKKIINLIVVCRGVLNWEYRETLEDGTSNLVHYPYDPFGVAHIERYKRDIESPQYDPEATRLWEFFQDYHFVSQVVVRNADKSTDLGNLFMVGK